MHSKVLLFGTTLALLLQPTHALDRDDDDRRGHSDRAGGERVVRVNCDRGRSLDRALERRGEELVVIFRGTCVEDVDINRGNVTLRGANSSATIQGALTLDVTEPGDTPAGGAVLLEDFSIISAANTGLTIGAGSNVTAERLTITQSGGNGIVMVGGSFLRCVDCVSEYNGSNGMFVVANSTMEIDGNAGSFSFNGDSGLSVGTNSELTVSNRGVLGRASPVVVSADGNGESGVVAFAGGVVSVDVDAILEANGNGNAGFGAGLLIGTGSAGFVTGTVNADGNVAGVASIAGSMLAFGGEINATNNSFGLFIQNEGILRLVGFNTSRSITGNNVGAFAQSGLLQLENTMLEANNALDLSLQFGAKARLVQTTPVTIACDGTQLTQGVTCP